jgi:hypothetical protein
MKAGRFRPKEINVAPLSRARAISYNGAMKLSLLTFLLALFPIALQAQVETNWQHLTTEKDIEVYRGLIPDSPLVGFKGKSVIEAPLAKVLSVVYDVEKIKEWLSDVKELKVLERRPNFGKVEYNRTKAQWPVRDRDFVYQVSVQIQHETKGVEILIESTEHPDAPNPKGVVRGELRSSRYFLKALDDKRTFLEVEIFADPKGSVPKWMVNLVQKSWPINTISGIRKISLDPAYQIHPDIIQAIETKKNQ